MVGGTSRQGDKNLPKMLVGPQGSEIYTSCLREEVEEVEEVDVGETYWTVWVSLPASCSN